MPVTLNEGNRFKTVRSVASLTDDTTPPTSAFTDDQRFSILNNGDYIVFYWTGTTPTGTLDVTVWMWDGAQGQFVKGEQVTGLAPNTLAKIQVYGASNAALLLSNTAGAGGTDIVVQAFGYYE